MILHLITCLTSVKSSNPTLKWWSATNCKSNATHGLLTLVIEDTLLSKFHVDSLLKKKKKIMAVRKDHIDTSWGSCFNWNFGGLLIQGTKWLKCKRTNYVIHYSRKREGCKCQTKIESFITQFSMKEHNEHV